MKRSALLIPLLLLGCVNMPKQAEIEQPKVEPSFTTRVTQATRDVADITNEAAGLLRAKRMTVTEARRVKSGHDRVFDELRTAKWAHEMGQSAVAEDRLKLAERIIVEMREFLKDREAEWHLQRLNTIKDARRIITEMLELEKQWEDR